MSLKIFAKRIAPFIATFIAGLFIASFFVSIALPTFHFGHRGYRQQEMDRLQSENDLSRENSCQLRRRNAELEQRNAELEKQNAENDTNFVNALDVPLPPVAPAPQKAPVAQRVR